MNNKDLLKLNEFNRNLLKYTIVKPTYFILLKNNKSIELLQILLAQGTKLNKNSQNFFLKSLYDNLITIKKTFIEQEYTYLDILNIFRNEKKLKQFKKYISLLTLLEEEENNYISILSKMEENYKKAEEYNHSINLIIEFLMFFRPSMKTDLEEIVKLFTYLGKIKIKDFKDDMIQKYNKKYGKIAKEREKITESKIFMYIYNIERSKYKNDEEKILNESLNKFDSLKEIFQEDDFNNIKEEYLEIIFNAFKKNKYKNREEDEEEIKEEEINKEILRLIKLYNLKENNIKNKMVTKNIFILSKKDEIALVSKAIIAFIEKIGVSNKDYSINLHFIFEISSKSFKIECIKMCLDLLKAIGIDLINKKQCLVVILKNIYRNQNIIEFLTKTNVDECRMLYDSSDDNDFIRISDIGLHLF